MDLLHKKDWALISVFASKFTDLLRKYYFVGGMPEAVAEYAERKNYAAVRRIHEQILFTYYLFIGVAKGERSLTLFLSTMLTFFR